MFKNEFKYDSWKRADHEAVRKTAGWYYFTHRLVEVQGDDASKFLDWLCVNDIAGCAVGRAKYTTILNEDGTIIDDVVVFRLEEEKFWVSTLYAAKLIDWMDEHEDDFDVDYDEVTDEWDMYAVQGPKSLEMINMIAAEDVSDQKFFSICDNAIDNVDVKISRAGFTGEKYGYEIYVDPDEGEAIEAKLAEAAEKVGARKITEFQVMVFTLATEAGFNLMTDMRELSPLELEPAPKINWDKDFIGKQALLAAKERPQRFALLGFEVEDESAHIECRNKGGQGSTVYKDGEPVGFVTKYTYSFDQEKCIGYMQVDASKVKVGDCVTVRRYNAVVTEKNWL